MEKRLPALLPAILFALVFFVGITQADPFGEGVEALERGDYSSAFQHFKPLAEAGDKAAQNNLGILYREGKGVSRSYAEAIRWFQLSANQGSAWGQYNLGQAYEFGQGVPENKQEALKWYRLSADQGDSEAQVRLGFMYEKGIGIAQDKTEAAKWYKLAADQNHPEARGALALLSGNVNHFAFIMPSFWVLVPDKAVSNGMLLFRRYGVIIEKTNLIEIDSRRSDEVRIISPAGLFINLMIFNCERDRRHSDFVTFHLPDNAHPTSFERQEWISRLEIRALADNQSMRVEGEYIKGDIFIDAVNYDSPNDFSELLSASRLIVEFGDKNDRITFAIGDQVGRAKIGPFIREFLTKFAPGHRFLSTAEIVGLCSNYKATGRF